MRCRLFFRYWIFLCGFLTALSAHADIFKANKPQFLPAEQAFVFSARQDGQGVGLHWEIADGYYLYQKEIRVEAENARLGEVVFPPSELYQDEFFGEVAIFRNALTLPVPLSEIGSHAVLQVTYQGCTKGFCYPPESREIALTQSAVENATVFAPPSQVSAQPEQEQLAQSLLDSPYAVFWFFLLGLGLAFTPCVLPMLPLLSAIVIGNQRPSTALALSLSFVYVQGMALTYTALGLIVAAVGLPFQVALQSPYVLIALSVVFSLLALSMFGLFSLQLPNSWQNKLTQLSQNQQSAAFSGVFVMGMIAGLVASPCTTAPLSGALLYVAQSGDMLKGALTLYLLALGMGLPLMLITVFGNRILPKSGAWLDNVKTAFGFVMLALPIFLLSRILPAGWELRLWAAWSTAFLLWFALQMNRSVWGKLFAGLALIGAIVCGKPLQDWVWGGDMPQQAAQEAHGFLRVDSYEALQAALKANPKRLAMVDLYADWCVACKEFEKYTFSDPKVQQAFDNILLLQVDMTKNSEQNRELMTRLNVIGLPTILFFDPQGAEIPRSRITGFLDAAAFLGRIAPLLAAQTP